MVSIKFLTCLTMTKLDSLILITLEELPNNWEKQWMVQNSKKCYKELQQMEEKLADKISTTSWPKKHSDFLWTLYLLYYSSLQVPMKKI
jgi:hypothetical protein